MRLMVTRPEPDGARTAAELRRRGHTVLQSPLLRIEPLADADLGGGPWGALLLTSPNAARALASHPRLDELRPLPMFAVGRGTAAAARAAGLAEPLIAEGDGASLARLVARHLAGKTPMPLLYVAGAVRAHDLAGDLAAVGLAVETVVVYRAVKASALEPTAINALDRGAVDGVLHFSRRSAEAYLACTAPQRLAAALAPTHYCVSERTAEPLRTAGATAIRVAAQPDEAVLLDLVGSG